MHPHKVALMEQIYCCAAQHPALWWRRHRGISPAPPTRRCWIERLCERDGNLCFFTPAMSSMVKMKTLRISDSGLSEMDLVIFFARLRNAVLLAACCDRSLLVSASGRLIYSSGTSQSWQRWNLWPFSGAGLPYRRIGAFKTTSAASSGTDPASEVCAKASRSSFFFEGGGLDLD